MVVNADSRSLHHTESPNRWHFLSWIESLQQSLIQSCRSASSTRPTIMFKVDKSWRRRLEFLTGLSQNSRQHSSIRFQGYSLFLDLSILRSCRNPESTKVQWSSVQVNIKYGKTLSTVEVKVEKLPKRLQHSARKPRWEMFFYRT